MAQAHDEFSLAYEIIQSIEFDCKFLTKSREVYKSNVGLALQNVTLDFIA